VDAKSAAGRGNPSRPFFENVAEKRKKRVKEKKRRKELADNQKLTSFTDLVCK